MKVGLFIPCYINAVYPEVGVASYKLLKSLGIDVDYPLDQTCCGQPMANAGFENESKELAKRFDQLFEQYDYIVGPSASCVVFVRDNYSKFLPKKEHKAHKCTDERIYEICEFIHDIVKPTALPKAVSFPHKVSIQNSCHGVRLMHLSAPSEHTVPYFNKLRNLLSLVKDIEIVEPERIDECCGFGGMFAAEEFSVSAQMGRDKVERHIKTGAEYIVGADSSCMMHQGGIIEREKLPIKTCHVVEILAHGL
ncbi:MAG: (Fe-S)-binding protein [Phocaeicola sp.]|nr:(Fe-S)-binding protein [Phocaeicola sp.]MDD7447718.1 (Fe-S)-binding protein [Prevotellaceae bacterium]MDY5939288.1 (Fe-S)-binding protein [Phocaeicola sp.]